MTKHKKLYRITQPAMAGIGQFALVLTSSRAKQMGYAREDYAGKPVIAVVNTWSDLTTCHSHFASEPRG